MGTGRARFVRLAAAAVSFHSQRQVLVAGH